MPIVVKLKVYVQIEKKTAMLRENNAYKFYNPFTYRRMAENGFAPPLGNFADISYLVEN